MNSHSERTSVVRFRDFVPGTLLASSPPEESSHLLVRRYLLPSEQPESYGPAMMEPHVVAIAKGSAIYEERHLNGPWQRCTVRPGDLFITGTREPYECRWKCMDGDGIEAVHLHIGLGAYTRALQAVFERDTGELVLADRSGFLDPFLSAVTLHAGTDLIARDPSARLMRESLAHTIAVHLARHYMAHKQPAASHPRALSASQTRKVVEYIRANLASNLSVEELATQVGLSPFHFSRAFKHATGLPPHQYVTRERVLKAQELILAGRLNFADIALEIGYESASHFTQVFVKHTGMTPNEYRKYF